jgi:hypothetical protein
MGSVPRLHLRQFFSSALILSLALVLAGIGLLYWSSRIDGNEDFATVVREAGAVALAIGALDLLHQIFLQRDLAQELLNAVGIKAEITEVGLDGIRQEQPSWERFFTAGTEFAVLPIDPVMWMRSYWIHVLQAAQARKVTVSLYVPSPESSVLDLLATRLNAPANGLADDLRQTTEGVLDAWRNGNIRRGSTLNVYTYGDLPGFGLAMADNRTLVHLTGTSVAPLGARSLTSEFSRGEGSDIGRWCSSQFEALALIGEPRTFTR